MEEIQHWAWNCVVVYAKMATCVCIYVFLRLHYQISCLPFFVVIQTYLSLSQVYFFFFFLLIKAEAVGRCSADLMGPYGSCTDFALHSAGNGRSTDMLHQEGCVIRLIFPCDSRKWTRKGRQPKAANSSQKQSSC